MKKIESFNSLKAIMLLILFYWHSPIPRYGLGDLGARTCEFLFVISGFCVAYNWEEKNIPDSFSFAMKYAKEKLYEFWPAHVVGIILALAFLGENEYNSLSGSKLLVNVLMLQTWSNDPNIYFSYNGVSWFLSCLLFCYFCAPAFNAIVKTKIEIKMLVVCLLRAFLEVNNIFCLSIHTNPVIRALEFLIGLMGFKILKKYCIKIRIEKWIATFIELGALFFWVGSWWNGNGFRFLFVIESLILICVFFYERGYVCCILKKCGILKALNKIQFEFYLFHVVVISIIEKYSVSIVSSCYVRSAIEFVAVIIFAILYKKCSMLLKTRINVKR